MTEDNLSWKEIARELSREANPQKRHHLEQELRAALERAGFKKFSRWPESSDDKDERKTGWS